MKVYIVTVFDNMVGVFTSEFLAKAAAVRDYEDVLQFQGRFDIGNIR